MTLVKKFVLTRKDGVDIYEYSSNLENGFVHEVGTDNYDVKMYCVEPLNVQLEEVMLDDIPEEFKEGLEEIENEQTVNDN